MAVSPDIDVFNSRRSTVFGTNGVLATGHPIAAQVGIDILQNGGNAFDAAIASAAARNVLEPMSTGIGGDVFMICRTADGDITAVQSAGYAPADADIEAVRADVASKKDINSDEVSMPTQGPHTVTVPGTVRGWETINEQFGTMAWGELLQPAVHYATEGFPVMEAVAARWREYGNRLYPKAKEIYFKDGRPPTAGELMRLPELGRSFEILAQDGPDAMYKGELAAEIVSELQSKGGFMAEDDLAEYEARVVDPVTTTYRGRELFELPPNNQAMIALEAFNIAEEIGAGTHAFDSPDRIHYFVESMKRAFHDGHHYITDPEFEEIPPLTSKDWARKRAQSVDSEARSVNFHVPSGNDTIAITCVDEQGNVVSFINSLFRGFGSGVVAGDTGILLQSRGASFSLESDHPNRLEPRKRPFHTLMPGLAKLGEDDWAAVSIRGGYQQPQARLQVLSNLIDYDLPLQTALDEPRWRYLESGQLAVEARMDSEIPTKLARRGHEVVIKPPLQFGGAQIARTQSGVLSAATEPRNDGQATGY